jgi:hypothetical protein
MILTTKRAFSIMLETEPIFGSFMPVCCAANADDAALIQHRYRGRPRPPRYNLRALVPRRPSEFSRGCLR